MLLKHQNILRQNVLSFGKRSVLRLGGGRRAKASSVFLVLLTLALFFTSAACGRRKHRAHIPALPSHSGNRTRGKSSATAQTFPVGYSETGVASWYGVPYHGRPAADGEIYNMESLVAAHRVMPFNTWLRVTNTSNLKSVEVRVIDRGPFVGGRILDLSKAAARQIDLLGPGIGPVKVEVISAPSDIRSNDLYAVQVGAFTVNENAESVRVYFATRYGSAQVAVKQGRSPLYRVLVGRLTSVADAQKLAAQISAAGQKVFVVRLDETVTGAEPAPPTPGTTP